MKRTPHNPPKRSPKGDVYHGQADRIRTSAPDCGTPFHKRRVPKEILPDENIWETIEHIKTQIEELKAAKEQAARSFVEEVEYYCRMGQPERARAVIREKGGAKC